MLSSRRSVLEQCEEFSKSVTHKMVPDEPAERGMGQSPDTDSPQRSEPPMAELPWAQGLVITGTGE